MAPSPVFCPSLDYLKAQMRLTTLVATGDAYAVFEGEVRAARVSLYSKLGADRVAEILTTAWAENPSTDAGIVRHAACELEVRIVLLGLRRRLPTSFRDASATRLREWNEAPEAPGRDPYDVENSRLSREIDELLDTVSGESDVGDASGIRCDNVEPDSAPAPLGTGAWPGGAYRGPD